MAGVSNREKMSQAQRVTSVIHLDDVGSSIRVLSGSERAERNRVGWHLYGGRPMKLRHALLAASVFVFASATARASEVSVTFNFTSFTSKLDLSIPPGVPPSPLPQVFVNTQQVTPYTPDVNFTVTPPSASARLSNSTKSPCQAIRRTTLYSSRQGRR